MWRSLARWLYGAGWFVLLYLFYEHDPIWVWWLLVMLMLSVFFRGRER